MTRFRIFHRTVLALVALAFALVGALSSCAAQRPAPAPPAAGFASGGFTTSAEAGTPAIAAGESVSILARVTSLDDTKALVDVEIYSPDHNRLYQRFFENQALSGGRARVYDVPWKVPAGLADATATVKIGIFTPDWSQLSHWNDDAVTLQIQQPSSHLLAPSSTGVTLMDDSSSSTYVSGANLPWYNWACDFGCGPNGGVSDPSVTNAVGSAFGSAQSGGFQVIRWWMFEGNPWQITTDANGAPTGLNPAIYPDVDAAVNLAAEHNLAFDFVLFSSPTALPSKWLTDPGERAQLAATLAPLFARYNHNPHVWSWEVFNEPEFDVWNNKIDAASVQQTVKIIATSVHQSSSAYVTVGSAMLSGLGLWTGLGLDYYQAHWYDSMTTPSSCAVCTDYASVETAYHLDAPLIIGEFYGGNHGTALRRETYFASHGFAGAWPWSLMPDRTNDKMGIDLVAAAAFAAGQRDGGSPISSDTQLPNGSSRIGAPLAGTIDRRWGERRIAQL